MKLEITQKGVFDAEGNELEIGSVITVKGDTVPSLYVNKARVLGAKITNPKKEEDSGQATSGANREQLEARAAELELKFHPSLGDDKLAAQIKAREEELAKKDGE